MSLPLKIAFWATVAGQIILLLAFIAFKEDTLRSGTSVLLETAPVDPRSILQGDFAILDYKIAELPNWAKDSDRGEPFYVQLYEHPNGVWVADAYTREEPRGVRVYIKGTVNDRQRLEFGIDTFFIPEGKGFIIGQATDVKVRVSIGSSGKAVIDDLILDGTPFDPTVPPKNISQKPPPPRPEIETPEPESPPVSPARK